MIDGSFIDNLIDRWESMEPDCEEDEDNMEEIDFDDEEIEMDYAEEVRLYGCSIAEHNYECQIYNEPERRWA